MDLSKVNYYEVTRIYFEGNLVKYKDHIYRAKNTDLVMETNIGQLPPEFPTIENDFWILYI